MSNDLAQQIRALNESRLMHRLGRISPAEAEASADITLEQDAAVARGYAHPQMSPDLDERIQTHVVARRGFIAAGGMEEFVDVLVKRRADLRYQVYQLEERITEILDEIERPGSISSTTCTLWRKCHDEYQGWKCDRRKGHDGWHGDRSASKEWEHDV